MITVTATLKTILNAAVGGSATFQLCGFGSDIPRTATAVLAKTGQVEADADATTGALSVALNGNDTITPAGTYYTVTIRDENGDVVQINAYQFTGAGPYDLSTAVPYVIS